MEERVQKLEQFVVDARRESAWVRQEFRYMDVRLTRIETRLDQTATKADVEAVKTEIHKWVIGTVIGLFIGFGGLFFAMSNTFKPAPTASQPQPIILAPAPPQPRQK